MRALRHSGVILVPLLAAAVTGCQRAPMPGVISTIGFFPNGAPPIPMVHAAMLGNDTGTLFWV
jgi:hypothetical protein